MSPDPEIVDSPAQRIAVIHLTIPREEIRHAMDPGIQELMATVAAQGIIPTGPWLSHHLRTDPKVFDFEIAVPVPSDVTPKGRVTMSELPAARVARTVYEGPYEGLGAAWSKFDKWVADNGHTPADDL